MFTSLAWIRVCPIMQWFLLRILTYSTFLSIVAQIALFACHYRVTELLDSLVASSLSRQMLTFPVVMPIIAFLVIIIISYILFISGIWFVAVSLTSLFNLAPKACVWLGIFLWVIAHLALFTLNTILFPNSFFAIAILSSKWVEWISIGCFCLAIFGAYLNFFWHRQYLTVGCILLTIALSIGLLKLYEQRSFKTLKMLNRKTQPNIILIGIDSLRPDFISYLNPKGRANNTPGIDQFLQQATIFTDSYTPLARTFPTWVSILTAKYPKFHHARNNLADPSPIVTHDTLAKRLRQAGYETFYATDEKRFSNITQAYGFDRIIGPKMGVNDFLLGGLSDFPLINVMINLSIGQFLFPYNYANRAAAITYRPDSFVQLLKRALVQRHPKPLFLALHLCLSHWPFTFAALKQNVLATEAEKYATSITAVDQQFRAILALLRQTGLLDNSIVVLLSDHGTTLGLPHDRMIKRKQYQGDLSKIKYIPIFPQMIHSGVEGRFVMVNRLDTSFGQGDDILSLKQYKVVLAWRRFGQNVFVQKPIKIQSSLLDIAPTILDLLHLRALPNVNGFSLAAYLRGQKTPLPLTPAPFYFETGHSISEIQTNNIFINQVVARAIGLYRINPQNSTLFIDPRADSTINVSKERAMLLGDWYLARFPAKTQFKLKSALQDKTQLTLTPITMPPFFVLVELCSGKWTIGFSSSLAKRAPVDRLLQNFYAFYGDELS